MENLWQLVESFVKIRYNKSVLMKEGLHVTGYFCKPLHNDVKIGV